MKALLLIYADTTTHENEGRMLNALVMADELKQKGHEVNIIFDGGGTEWVPKLEDEEYQMHGLYKKVEDCVTGICEFCAGAFDTGIDDDRLSGEQGGHTQACPSTLRKAGR